MVNKKIKQMHVSFTKRSYFFQT